MSKVATAIFVIFTIILLFVIIALGLFSITVFLGMLLIGMLYLFGYLYVLNYYKMLEERDRRETQNKKKLDYCWDRANLILKKMIGGQGLTWNKGVGRRSEFRSFHNGVQSCGFRSMEGYLVDAQQLVVLIYDIENDDIVRYIADPPPIIIDNHFYEFKPFQSKETFSGGGMMRRPYSPYSRYRRAPSRGLTISRGGSDYDNYDGFSAKAEPTDEIVNDALKKLKGG